MNTHKQSRLDFKMNIHYSDILKFVDSTVILIEQPSDILENFDLYLFRYTNKEFSYFLLEHLDHPLGHFLPPNEVNLRRGLSDLVTTKKEQILNDISFGDYDYLRVRLNYLSNNMILCVISDYGDLHRSIDKSKHDFMTNISQEIRNPLNNSLAMTDLLLDTPMTSEQLDYIRTIRQCSYNLMSTLNDVLDYSKLQAHTLNLESVPFSLRDCLSQSLEIVENRAKEKGLEILTTIDPEVPAFIFGDCKRLRQILVNLLNNAIKYSDTHSGNSNKINLRSEIKRIFDLNTGDDITLSVRSKKPFKFRFRSSPSNSGNYKYELQFQVQDYGRGIEKRNLSRIFHSFMKEENEPGIGLGLSISRELVNLMGGSIWATSEVNKGSIFYFTIMTQEAPEIEDTKIPDRVKINFKNKSVLIIDSDGCDYFTKWNMKVTHCKSLNSAKSALKKSSQFNVIFVDVCQNLKPIIGIPIVGLVGTDCLDPDRHKLPYVGILQKPIREGKLYNILADLFPDTRLSATKLKKQPNEVEILSADDLATNQKVLEALLNKLGYVNVDLSYDGVETLEKLEEKKYDVLILDSTLPNKSTFDVAKEIDKRYPKPDRPYIIVSGNISRMEKEKLKSYVDVFLPKPIFSEILERILRGIYNPSLRELRFSK